VRAGLAFAILAAVQGSFGQLFGRGPGVALLVAFSGLKLLETRSTRDAFVCGLLGYFLVAAHFLHSESIPSALYMLAALVALTAALVGLERPLAGLGPRRQLGLAATLLAQASPLAAVLFLLFPRLPGPLWALPSDAFGAVSGLDEHMAPGQISQLGLSDEVAFRARFDGEPPPAVELYWRGPVLWKTDGRRWGPGEGMQARPEPVTPGSEPVRYAVTLEPHGRRWLFVLDAPVQTPADAGVRADYQVLARTPVRSRVRFEAASATRYAMRALPEAHRAQALALPNGHHPRTVALARTWRQDGLAGEALVARAWGHFRDEPFRYTLTPGLVEGDPVDGFLFGTRAGFCEHYAAAFVVLMRAAGLPARVVTGYQGGEVNPVDGYLVVRQRDAHAWAEVWLEDRGWVRVDPTAAVAPVRVEGGADRALPRLGAPLLGLTIDEGSGAYRLLRGARHTWEAMHNGWNQWVLGYGQTRQRQLLARIGLDAADWRQVGAALAVLAGAPLLLLVPWLGLRAERRGDPARRLYERFCRRLARRGVVRGPAEPPLRFAERAAAAAPDLAEGIGAITESYVALRYRPGGGDLRRLRALVRRFRPGLPGKTSRSIFG
jgi:transglutaminase-like putative cysteine protease